MEALFSATVLGRYEVKYFLCPKCGYVRTEAPYWLDEAYSEAIAVTDTGVLQRNSSVAAKLSCLIYFCLDPKACYLDIAGGYGILTRLMRDSGFDYYWDDKYCNNLLARGYEYPHANGSFFALTGIEVIEHVPDPHAFIRDLMAAHDCRTFIFSTVPYSGETPPDPSWWYYSTITGQHISFFAPRTLAVLSQKLGLSLHSCGGLYILTDRSLRNRWMLRALTSRLAGPLSLLVRILQGSRVERDHVRMTSFLESKSDRCRS